MKTFKLFTLLIFLGLFVFNFGLVFAQTQKHTLQDYGYGEEDAKYFTPEELEELLKSKTPQETQDDLTAKAEQILKNGTPEEKAAVEEAIRTFSKSNDVLSQEVVNCFDPGFYKFQSVQTDISSSISNFKLGDTINLTGTIRNENDYPIISGTFYIKIFRVTDTEKNPNGVDVIDQFTVVDNIVIPTKSSIPVSFSWKVPNSLISGDYKIVSFFIVDKKYNLLGLSFTNDVIGNTFDFKIIGDKYNVQFDSSGVFINKEKYFFAAYPPRISIEYPATISAKIDNSTKEDQLVDVVWKLYKWDSINTDNFIRTKSEKVVIAANSSKNIEINIQENTEPVYYLIGELKYKDSKSILDIRFVRPEVDKLRINFPSITSFPIKKGEKSTVFSCLYNSGTSFSVPGGKLTITLTDIFGNVIEDYTYQGQVTGSMMAVKDDFISRKNLDHFFLNVKLWQNSELVDQSILEYDCKKIDPNFCYKKDKTTIYIVVGAIIILIVVILSTIFSRRKKMMDDTI